MLMNVNLIYLFCFVFEVCCYVIGGGEWLFVIFFVYGDFFGILVVDFCVEMFFIFYLRIFFV